MSDNNERLEHVFKSLAMHIGEGILDDWAEEQIILIEDQYRDETAPALSRRQINFLEKQLRYGNANS
jgi:hypothetical protein